MIITLTGLPGSGKTSIAKGLSKHIHIKYFPLGNYFRKIAKREKISVLELTKHGDLIDYIDKYQLKLARKYKNVIIDSRMGAYLFKKRAKYRIYLHAPLKVRVKRISNRDNESYKGALKETLSRERQELNHYTKHYKTNYQNKNLYNIIINTEHTTVEDAVKKILKKITTSK